MKAMILAGGRATRLYPLTLHMPKHLLMINGYPIISYIFDHCAENGLKDLVLCVSKDHYQDFRNALGTGTRSGIRLKYSSGPQRLGTGGRVLRARSALGGDAHFVVYYGDIITSFDLRALINEHMEGFPQDGRMATLALSSAARLISGVAKTNEQGRILDFSEKPMISEVSPYQMNVGIGVFSRRILRYCKPQNDLFRNVIPLVLQKGFPVFGHIFHSQFFDVGTFASFERLLGFLPRRRSPLK